MVEGDLLHVRPEVHDALEEVDFETARGETFQYIRFDKKLDFVVATRLRTGKEHFFGKDDVAPGPSPERAPEDEPMVIKAIVKAWRERAERYKLYVTEYWACGDADGANSSSACQHAYLHAAGELERLLGDQP